jgi:hypothetical protein
MDRQAVTGLALMGFAGVMWLLFGRGRKNTASGGVVFVRVIPPGSNVARNLVVLAVLGGLAWFFWYVMGTRCGGTC